MHFDKEELAAGNSDTPDWSANHSYVLVETPYSSVGGASVVASPRTKGPDLDATVPSFGDGASLGLSIEWPPPGLPQQSQSEEPTTVRWTKSTKGRPCQNEVFADSGNVTFQDLEVPDSDSEVEVVPLQPRVRGLPGNTDFQLPSGEVGSETKSRQGKDAAAFYLEELGVAALAQEVTLRDLEALKSFRHPPAVVCQVMEAAAVLLGVKETTWTRLRPLLDGNFLYKIRDFDIRQVTHVQAGHFNSLMRCSAFAEGLLEEKCPAAAALADWCRAVARLLSRHRRLGGLVADGSENAGDFLFGDMAGGKSWTRPPATSRRQYAAATVEPQHQEDAIKPLRQSPVQRPDLEGLEVAPDLWNLQEAELTAVKDLRITRPDVGSVMFLGETDCRGFLGSELKELVILRSCEVIVYPDTQKKPPEGQGLNKPTEITLFGCLPKSGDFHSDAAIQRYKDRVRGMTEEKGAEFIDYDWRAGVWRFRVRHF